MKNLPNLLSKFIKRILFLALIKELSNKKKLLASGVSCEDSLLKSTCVNVKTLIVVQLLFVGVGDRLVKTAS